MARPASGRALTPRLRLERLKPPPPLSNGPILWVYTSGYNQSISLQTNGYLGIILTEVHEQIKAPDRCCIARGSWPARLSASITWTPISDLSYGTCCYPSVALALDPNTEEVSPVVNEFHASECSVPSALYSLTGGFVPEQRSSAAC